MLGNTVECQARLVGNDVEVLTDSLGGFLDLEAQIRLRDILDISPMLFFYHSYLVFELRIGTRNSSRRQN